MAELLTVVALHEPRLGFACLNIDGNMAVDRQFEYVQGFVDSISFCQSSSNSSTGIRAIVTTEDRSKPRCIIP
jgi:hypothetical protein